jgi:hypothetical protein
MRKAFALTFVAMHFSVAGVAAEAPTLEQELRAEIAQLKAQINRIEELLARLEKEGPGASAAVPDEAKRQAPPAAPETKPVPTPKLPPALNTPPMLPPSDTSAYRKSPPRIDVLFQVRGVVPRAAGQNSTFAFRKVELGFKGHVAANVDYSVELDAVRPEDPFRRTYIRLSHLSWLHVKLGLEKTPIGLDELTPNAQIPFVERSEVSNRFSTAEDLGIHLESRWTHWLFQASLTNGGRRILRDNNGQKDVTARVVWAPKPWLSLGTATLQGHAGADRLERRRYNAEFKLGSNLTGFQSEFFRAQDEPVWSSAYYLAGYYAFPTRKPWLTHVQPVLRYGQIDRSDRLKASELRLLTFGVSFLFSEHRSKFQMNYLKDLHTGSLKDELRAQYQVEF